jgi:signal transduction histidine kinase
LLHRSLLFNTYYPITHDLWLYLLAITVLGAMALYTLQYRKIKGALAVSLTQLCKACWLVSLVSIGFGTDLKTKLVWLSFERMMAVLLPFIWFIAILQLSRLDRKFPKVIIYIIGIFDAFLGFFILTTGWLGLYWNKAWLDGSALIVARGSISELVLLGGYLLSGGNIVLIVYWIIKSVGWHRKQALWYLVTSLFTLAGHVATFIPGLEFLAPQASGYLITGIVVTWLYYQGNVSSILPRAQNTVIQNMFDGLLVIDKENNIVEMNPAAERIFYDLPVKIGAKFGPVIASWPDLARLDEKLPAQTMEVVRANSGGCRYYQLNTTMLYAAKGDLLGKVMVLKDITRQKQEQLQKLEEQKALSILAERNRLGRELHDDQGQIWSYLKLKLETIQTLLGKTQIAAAGEQVEQLIGITRDLNTDVRESIASLKNFPSQHDFVTILQEYLDLYQKNYHMDCRLFLPEESFRGFLSPTAEVQLFRIIQEALTNIRKHAKASRAEVSIHKTTAMAIITITDDGCGFNVLAVHEGEKSYGIQVMKERALEAGGFFRIESQIGQGTKIIIQFAPGKETTNENTAGR